MGFVSLGDVEGSLEIGMGIYSSYLTKIFLSNFVVVLIVFVFLGFSINAISIIGLLILHNVRLLLTLKIFLFMIPEIVVFVLPASFLISSLITLFNLTENNENIVLSSAGVGDWEIVKPVFMLAIAFVLPYFLLLSYFAPISNSALNRNLYNLVRLGPSLVLKPGVFLEPFDNITIYGNDISHEDQGLEQVLVMDKRDPNVTLIVAAKRLHILPREDTAEVIFKFIEGNLFAIPKDGVPRNLMFKDYILSLSPLEAYGQVYTREPKPKEMTLFEIFREARRPNLSKARYGDLMFSLYNRFLLPVVGVLMVLLGGLLPLRFHFRRRTAALTSGLLVFFAYYILYSGMKSLAKSGAVMPFLCSFIPPIFLGLLLSKTSLYGVLNPSGLVIKKQ